MEQYLEYQNLLNQNIAEANEEFAEKKNKFDELLSQAEGVKQDIERTTDAIGGIFGVKPVEFASKKIGRFAYEKITGKKLKPEGEEKPTEQTAKPEQTESTDEFRPYQDTDPEPQSESSNPVTGEEDSLRSRVADQLEDINEPDLANAIRGGSTERSVIEDAYDTLRNSGFDGRQTAQEMLEARRQATARRTETEDQPQEEEYQVDRPAGQPTDEPAGAPAEEAGAGAGEEAGGISETAFGSTGATTTDRKSVV